MRTCQPPRVRRWVLSAWQCGQRVKIARMSVEHYAGLIDLTRIDLTGEVA